MTDFWDPGTIDWEMLGDPSIDWELLGDPYLQPDMYFPGDLSSRGDPQAYDIATLGRQLDNMKKLNAILRDPFFNYRVAIETGQDTFPFEQLTQPGNPWLADPTGLGGSGSAADYNALGALLGGIIGGGGGGGGGFDGGGGGGGGSSGLPAGSYLAEDGTMVVPTPLLSSTLRSTDAVLRTAAEGIDEGYDPGTVLQAVYKNVPDPELRKLYADQVKTMFDERNQREMAQTPGGGPGVGEPSELAKTAAKWGVADPLSQYGAETGLPSEVETELNRFLGDEDWAKRAASTGTREANRLERDAIYQPYTGGESVTVDRPTKIVGPGFTTGGVRPEPPIGTMAEGVAPTAGDASYYGVDLDEGLNPGRWYRAFSQSQPTEPVRGIAAGAGGGGGRSGSFGVGDSWVPEQNRRYSILDFVNTPEQREVQRSDRVVTRNGRKQRTNAAGANAARKRARAEYLRKNGAAEVQRHNDSVRDYTGIWLAQQGRTPQRDAMRATMDYLRRAGLNI